MFLPIQCYGGICAVKGTALLRQQQYGNLVLIRAAMYSLRSTKNRPVEAAWGRRLDHQRPQLRLLEPYCVNTACLLENAATLSHPPPFFFAFTCLHLQSISLHGQTGPGQHQHSRMGNHETSIVIQQALPSPQSSSVITQAPSTNRQIG